MGVTQLGLTFWEEFTLVFQEIGWVPAIMLLLGMIFVIIEIFQPGFGFFGISGTILIIIGISVRMYYSGAGNPIIQMVVLIGLVAVVLTTAFLIMVWSMKKGWLSRTSFVSKGKAVSEEQTLGTGDFRGLLGKSGITLCPLRPSGNVRIDGEIYDVVAQAEYIDKGVQVTVVQVEGVRVVVRPTQSEVTDKAE